MLFLLLLFCVCVLLVLFVVVVVVCVCVIVVVVFDLFLGVTKFKPLDIKALAQFNVQLLDELK